MRRVRGLRAVMSIITAGILVLFLFGIAAGAWAAEDEGCYEVQLAPYGVSFLSDNAYIQDGTPVNREYAVTLMDYTYQNTDAGVYHARVGSFQWIIYAEEPDLRDFTNVTSVEVTEAGLWRICTSYVPAGGEPGAATAELLVAYSGEQPTLPSAVPVPVLESEPWEWIWVPM